ncbi:hypothetical protein XA68_14234 [Ophiocordyceps unilateralis]|uniref:FAM192A/Fyv6 N-terminal domain-containing protein n=1 Tax=Ophiocordyceps unilateralis TaxID=268505 RepID=A0A2A9P9S5_OPHUN|nr:hypothetical protein XA68_14234 [Ophiocordyceps unilateralis]
MASRFVSGGTMGEKQTDEEKSPAEPEQRQPLMAAGSHKAEWEAVQQELAAERKRREEARLKAAGGEEKSLYDILQANKAAKQAAFEEKHRLKNQFRALDDDEAEFLDDVRERSRLEEERVKKETEERVRAFHARRSGDHVMNKDDENDDIVDDDEKMELDVVKDQNQQPEENWAVASVRRKRKRAAREGRGLLGRKTSVVPVKETEEEEEKEEKEEKREKKKKKKGSALVDYGSDESGDGEDE